MHLPAPRRQARCPNPTSGQAAGTFGLAAFTRFSAPVVFFGPESNVYGPEHIFFCAEHIFPPRSSFLASLHPRIPFHRSVSLRPHVFEVALLSVVGFASAHMIFGQVTDYKSRDASCSHVNLEVPMHISLRPQGWVTWKSEHMFGVADLTIRRRIVAAAVSTRGARSPVGASK